jgi:DNA-binding response OmpR family regulator
MRRARFAPWISARIDYLTKPFGVDELFARVRAALRHRLQQQGKRPVFRSGDLSVDLVRRIVTGRGEPVKLTPREGPTDVCGAGSNRMA